ncbi:MAG: DivIVA domain-containing protein [Actinomycetota bacterium]|nr:DivIVA domain-containing protein [Actinomycetota bacterium]
MSAWKGGEFFLKEEMAVAISPMDIHLKEFSTVDTGGYSKEDVDSFLDTLADELERLINRTQELEDFIKVMKRKVSRYDEMEQTLQNALMNAQKSAGNILQDARNQAASIIKKAQDRSDRILEDMQKEKAGLLDSFSSIREQIIDKIPQMRELLEKSQGLVQEFEVTTRKAEISVPSAASKPEEPEESKPPEAEEGETEWEPGEEGTGEKTEEEDKPSWR